MRALRQSEIAEYLVCPRRAQYKYQEKRYEPGSEKAARGTAAHAGIELAVKRKIAGEAVTREEIEQATRDASTRALATLDKSSEEADDIAVSADRSVALATHFALDVLPTINPIASEKKFEATISGVDITGTIDLIARGKYGETQIRDTKTTSRAPVPAWGDPRYRMQLGIYALSQRDDEPFDAPPMSAALDFLILSERKKDPAPQVRHLPVLLDPLDLRGEMETARETILFVASRTHIGSYPRNPLACMPYGRPCSFMRECQPHRASAAERVAASAAG